MSTDQRPRTRLKSDSVTAQDVADSAGVSIATVSRVLNKSGRCSPAMAQRVWAAAKRLGYVPNAAARALASNRFQTIGAVVPTIQNPNFAVAVEALQHGLITRGYTLLLASSNYDEDQVFHQVRTLVAQGVDAVVLVGNPHKQETIAFLKERSIPYLLMWVTVGDGPCVGFDNYAAAKLLTDYLLDIGHRELAVIAGVTVANDRARARVAGVRDALLARGLHLPRERLIERPYRIIEGQIGLRALLTDRVRPTAIVCGNDVLAFGALLEAQNAGIDIPRELSIVGFDDLEFSSQLRPALTTIHIGADEIGRRTAEQIVTMLAGLPFAPIIETPVELVVRASSAPPPVRPA